LAEQAGRYELLRCYRGTAQAGPQIDRY